MFQTETEDMLPRAAPKPSAAPNEGEFKPAVPEVSMVFGAQPQPSQQQSQTSAQQQQQAKPPVTYAAWKKQVLPQVRFPPELGAGDCAGTLSQPRSNHYPLRVPATISPLATVQTSAANILPSTSVIGDTAGFFRRSLERVPQMSASPITAFTGAYNTPLDSANPHTLLTQQRRSLDAIASLAAGGASLITPIVRPSTAPSAASDVLTICAGTQTDNQMLGIGGSDTLSLHNYATKQDLEQLLTCMQQMRTDQLRLLQICETLLLQQEQQQQQPQTHKSDAATQYENNEPPASQAYHKLPYKPNFHTPHAPAAQSTAYQVQTPPAMLKKPQQQQEVELQKVSTDKTMVMNELALKYLPNEKLSELLHDMQLCGTPNSVVERIAVAAKGPNDISNASYRYLKKYRLLPEEYNSTSPNQQQNSPYQQRPTDSPILLHHDTSDGDNAEDLLNLEHIRSQPKFQ